MYIIIESSKITFIRCLRFNYLLIDCNTIYKIMGMLQKQIYNILMLRVITLNNNLLPHMQRSAKDLIDSDLVSVKLHDAIIAHKTEY